MQKQWRKRVQSLKNLFWYLANVCLCAATGLLRSGANIRLIASHMTTRSSDEEASSFYRVCFAQGQTLRVAAPDAHVPQPPSSRWPNDSSLE